MIEDVAWVSLVPAVAAVGTCQLCTTAEAELGHAVVVQLERGGRVQLASCDPCAQAVRRLAAATGGHARFSTAEVAAPAATRPPARRRRATVPDGPPVLIHELAERVRDGAGMEYVVQVCGWERADGTWVGWLDFVALGAADALRTGAETTQPDRGALAYWATGLEPVYLEGAFARARRVS